MKIAVLWATWFVGSHVVRHFFGIWDTVYGFGRRNMQWHIHKFCTYILLTAENIVQYWPFDVVINCIADVGYGKQDTNLHKILLDILNNIATKHLIHISTSSVYMWLEKPLQESLNIAATSLMNAYAKNKLLIENSVMWTSHIPKITILRPRAIYWCRDRVLLYHILKSTIKNRVLFFWKSETNILMSMTHIKSLLEAITCVITQQSSPKEIYNVADSKAYNVYAVFAAVSKVFFNTYPISLNKNILHIMKLLNYNKYLWIKDIFTKDTVLDCNKIQQIWYQWNNNFFETLPFVYTWWKQDIWSVINMKKKLSDIPWMAWGNFDCK